MEYSEHGTCLALNNSPILDLLAPLVATAALLVAIAESALTSTTGSLTMVPVHLFPRRIDRQKCMCSMKYLWIKHNIELVPKNLIFSLSTSHSKLK